MSQQPVVMLAYLDAFRLLALIALLGIPIALLLRRGNRR
jgi:hypothetical protein